MIMSDEKYDLQILQQNINKSNIIVVDHYLQNNERFIIICFEKQMTITELNNQDFVQTILSKNNEYKIYFVPNNQFNFNNQNKMNHKEEQNFETEIYNLSDKFVIDSENDQLVNFFWNIIKRCLFAYLIRKGYYECMKDRKNEYIENEAEKNESKMFKIEEFIPLRLVDLTFSSKVRLYYHIESEKLFIIKTFFENGEKLNQREIENYQVLNYPFLPKFYGLVEEENGRSPVIEFIQGQTFDMINEKELNLKQKLIILYKIINTFIYLHQTNFIYRDFKPNNLILDQNNDIVLIDFDRMIQKKDNMKDEDDSFEYTNDFNSLFVDPKIVVDKCSPSFENDIYSFGKFIYYIFGDDNTKLQTEYPEIAKIAKQCTTMDLKERQTFLEIEKYFVSNIFQNKKYFSFEDLKKELLQLSIINSLSLAKNQNKISEITDYGLILLKGKLIKQDISKAIRYLTYAADHNDMKAQCNLGVIFYEGSYVKMNINKAIHYFTLASNQNSSYAQFCLGVVYATNKYIKMDINKAIYYFKLSSEQDFTLAHLHLGQLYYNGMHVPKDIDKAIYYFTLAANKNSPCAQNNMAFIYLDASNKYYDINKAIHYFTLAANQNMLESQSNLGVIYYEGKYIARDINKAIYYFTLAANQNDYFAQCKLGEIYMIFKNDINKAIYYFTIASSHSIDSISEYYLGLIYYDEKYKMQDADKAIYYFTIAANKNNDFAMCYLGKIFYENELINRDINKSIYYLTLASNNNNPKAQYYLGIIFYEGKYVTRDINKSIYYLTLSSNQNYIKSQSYLGSIYIKGEYIKPDFNKSIYYLTKAANQNDPLAQINLGSIYYQGIYVKRDVNKSIRYLTMAAKQISSIAYFHLGTIYYEGKYIPRDINKTIYFYTLSAEYNHQYAQFYLAQIYFEGKYVKQNINKSLNYLYLSVKNQNYQAMLLLADIYFEGKYLKRDIKKAFDLYKKVSSFNNQYAKNNLGVIYRIGFDEVKPNNDFAKIFFNEAIKQKNDIVSMFNLANIYLDEKNENESIKLLIKSYNLVYSKVLLFLLIVKKYKYFDKRVIQNDLEKLIDDSNDVQTKVFSFISTYQFLYYINEPIDTELVYQILRKKYLIYVNQNFIFYQENNQENNDEGYLMKNINESFYEGFNL